MRVKMGKEWRDGKINVTPPPKGSRQAVALRISGVLVELSEDEAYALCDQITDVIE